MGVRAQPDLRDGAVGEAAGAVRAGPGAWSDPIAEEWDLTLHFASKAGQGLEEFEMDEIIETIANSL